MQVGYKMITETHDFSSKQQPYSFKALTARVDQSQDHEEETRAVHCANMTQMLLRLRPLEAAPLVRTSMPEFIALAQSATASQAVRAGSLVCLTMYIHAQVVAAVPADRRGEPLELDFEALAGGCGPEAGPSVRRASFGLWKCIFTWAEGGKLAGVLAASCLDVAMCIDVRQSLILSVQSTLLGVCVCVCVCVCA
jgi:hypothetical protein